MASRVPIIGILGHVDHGKTTLLDKIRNTNVQGGEVQGITQKISAFTVDIGKGKLITFIDTPGHEAFSLMRLRGGSIADIVLLIVAADDSVKPQTEESIEIIKNSESKPIIVITKCDLPNIKIEKVKRDLAQRGLTPEDMGGKVPVVEVSGKTGQGVKELLDLINLFSDVEGINREESAGELIDGRAYVLESIKSTTQGYIATVVVPSGELKRGDTIAFKVGDEVKTEKLKGFVTEDNRPLEGLKDGYGGRIVGLSTLLEPGTSIIVVNRVAKSKMAEVVNAVEKSDLSAEKEAEAGKEEITPDFWADYFKDSSQETAQKKALNLVIKSSTQGSLLAIQSSLAKLSSELVDLKVIASGVGSVSQSDVDTASISRAIILSFETEIESGVIDYAAQKKVLIRKYNIIYKLVDEIKETVEMLEVNDSDEEEIGIADVRAIFTLTNGDKVIGGRVESGFMKKNHKCYIVRGDDIIAEGKIISLKHQKNEISQAEKNHDFGAIISPTPDDVQEHDKIQCVKVDRR